MGVISVGSAERVAPYGDGLRIGRFVSERRARRAVALAFPPAQVEHGPLAQLQQRRAAWLRPARTPEQHETKATIARLHLAGTWRGAWWGLRPA